MKFIVVEGSEKDDFENEVSSLLSDGWKCQGGVFIFDDTWKRYYMAMILDEK